MKRLAPLLLLAGCSPQTAADGYTFEHEQFVNQDLRVRVELVSPAQLEARGPSFKGVKAWGKVDPAGSCTIYVVDPRTHYAPEWLGHELTHCVFGEWHPEQNEMRLPQ